MGATALVITLCALAACNQAPPTAPSRNEIVGVTWRLQTIQRLDQTSVAVPQPERFTMRLGDDGRVTLRADCNMCSGLYQLTGAQLRATELACTRAFCGSNSLDAEFLRVFEAASIESADGALIVSRAGTRLTFTQ